MRPGRVLAAATCSLALAGFVEETGVQPTDRHTPSRPNLTCRSTCERERRTKRAIAASAPQQSP
eukprot:scaffold277074_cov28-Tisochrysis_lutea.AAC.1